MLEAPAQAVRGGGARRILVVEDDADIRTTLQTILATEGFAVEACTNGQQALSQLTTSPIPDLILLDLLMPIMNGWQFCEARKTDPNLAAVPVIAMSSAVSRDPRSPYYLDVDDFVAKPIDLADLVRKLETYGRPVITTRPRRSLLGP